MNKKNSWGKVLFIGRKGCAYSEKIKILLKKQAEKLYYFESKKIGEKIDSKYLRLSYNYIFSFRGLYILKANLLKKVKKAAINFHPGPPEYRGTGSANYAIFFNSTNYGCTAHLIDEKIDHGQIIDVKRFNISNNDNVSSVLNKTYKKMFNQAVIIINNIEKEDNYLENKIIKSKTHKWSRKVRKLKDLEKFYEINKEIKRKDFLRKIRATVTTNFKPYIKLYGKKFILE